MWSVPHRSPSVDPRNEIAGPMRLPVADSVYALCGTAAFHDIQAGSNGTYSAGPGYDPVTGLGSPDVGALLRSF